MSKYEQLIEYIINEQEDKARELFHQIVVEKSREIYESLIDEQDLAEIGGNEVEEMVNQITGDERGMNEEDMDLDVEVGDGEADMGMDSEMGDDMGGEGEGELEDRVMDLEDALDELKAEFDALMADEGDADMGGDQDMGMGDEGDEGEEDDEEDMMEAPEKYEDLEEDVQESRQGRKMTEAEWIREYVEKIGEYPGEQKSPTGKMAGTGAQSEQQGEKNTKSPVAGKNDMGGKVVGGSPDNTVPTGPKNPSNAYTKGQGTINSGNKNVPGGNAAKIGKAPAAKKGEEGAVNKKSIES